MDEVLTAMDIASRVLVAIHEKRDPKPEDVAALRRLAPRNADMPTDELACKVIRDALIIRRAIREARQEEKKTERERGCYGRVSSSDPRYPQCTTWLQARAGDSTNHSGPQARDPSR